MNYQVEIRVPISPTPDFFRRIHFMAASLRRLAGAIGDHVLVVCVGGDVEAQDLYKLLPWSTNYPLVWRWADRERFRQDDYWETSREIFRQAVRGRYVICADADILFVKGFADLLEHLANEPAVAGVIAHAPPFRTEEPSKTWKQLCDGYKVPPPSFAYEHTGWGIMVKSEPRRYSPPYFNFGMVIAPAELMEKISAGIEAADDYVNAHIETFFRFQIALTLTIQKYGLTVRALPLRYNFPNDPRFDAGYPEELKDVRILHYLRCEIVHRERDFSSLSNVASFIGRQDLRGSNEIFRQRVEELYPLVAAEEG